MLKVWLDDTTYDKDYHQQCKVRYNEFLDTINSLTDKNIDYVMQFTCNYETFIDASVNNCVQVDTCNNHPWDDMNLPMMYNSFYGDYNIEESPLYTKKYFDIESKTWTSRKEINDEFDKQFNK